MDEQFRFVPSNMIGEIRSSGDLARPALNDNHELIVETVSGSSVAEKTIFGQYENAPSEMEKTIVTLTAPVDKLLTIKGGKASALIDCVFKLKINGLVKELLYNSWTQRNVKFDCIEQVNPGDTITITGEIFTAPQWDNVAHDLNACIFYEIV